MKTSFTLVSSLVAVLSGGAFAACSSLDPSSPEIGVDPSTLIDADAEDTGPADTGPADTGPADSCAPETDDQLVAASCTGGKDCGALAVTDKCGAARTISCGVCGSDPGVACNAATNACECTGESDATLVASACTAVGKTCGSVAVTDRCGQSRTLACGTCDAASGATCNAATNTCSCVQGKYTCGNACVRNCLEGCVAAPTSCEDTKLCVSTCGGTSCAGKATECTTFSNANGRANVCKDLGVGGACASFSAACTTAANCGFTSSRATAVCIVGGAAAGECFYCGAPGSNGLACGGTRDGGVAVCNEATRICE